MTNKITQFTICIQCLQGNCPILLEQAYFLGGGEKNQFLLPVVGHPLLVQIPYLLGKTSKYGRSNWQEKKMEQRMIFFSNMPEATEKK